MADYLGQLGVGEASSEVQTINFLIKVALGNARTATLVRVAAVNGGGVAAPPTVDVIPLVNQIDSAGNSTPHSVVHGVPAFRLQGGLNAFINDPKVGDIGSLVVGDRDQSSVVAAAGQANPGSFRRNSLSDGMYFGGLVNTGTPNQYIYFKPDGGMILFDSAENRIETHISGINRITVQTAEPPSPLKLIILGGDGNIGVYDFISTGSGPALNVKARIG